jgi:hypothetical protein
MKVFFRFLNNIFKTGWGLFVWKKWEKMPLVLCVQWIRVIYFITVDNSSISYGEFYEKSFYSTYFCTAKHNSRPKFHMVSVKKWHAIKISNCKVSFCVTVQLKELCNTPKSGFSGLFGQNCSCKSCKMTVTWDWNYKQCNGPVSVYTEGIGAVLWYVMVSEQARSAIRTL